MEGPIKPTILKDTAPRPKPIIILVIVAILVFLPFVSSTSLNRPWPLYIFVLMFATVMLFITWRILQSPFGKLLQAVRENEERARACGFNTTLVKFFSLVISSFYAGLAGALNTVFLGYVPLSTLFWLTSGTIVMMTILGGKGTLLGPLVGAGKTTLFNLIAGVYQPTSGKVIFKDRDITRLPLHRVSRLGITKTY